MQVVSELARLGQLEARISTIILDKLVSCHLLVNLLDDSGLLSDGRVLLSVVLFQFLS